MSSPDKPYSSYAEMVEGEREQIERIVAAELQIAAAIQEDQAATIELIDIGGSEVIKKVDDAVGRLGRRLLGNDDDDDGDESSSVHVD